MPVDPPTVSLLFHADAPQRYTARLGSGGWLEGNGFSREAALDKLADAIAVAGSEVLAREGVQGPEAISGWLREHVQMPVLAE